MKITLAGNVIICLLVLAVPMAHADSQKPQTFNIDAEVARVRKEIRKIDSLAMDRDGKSKRKKTFLDSEIKRAQQKLKESQSMEVNHRDSHQADAQEAKESNRVRATRKTSDDIQRFLDILRGMQPKN